MSSEAKDYIIYPPLLTRDPPHAQGDEAVDVQLGLSVSHDAAPGSSIDRRPSATACLNYSTATNDDNFYVCPVGINNGKYAYNHLQQ